MRRLKAATVLTLAAAACTPVGFEQVRTSRSLQAQPETRATVAESPVFPYADPEAVGLSTDGLNRLGEEITAWVANGELVGAELLIVKDGLAVFHEAYGWSDREERRPVERNSIWSIQSMSKPFTSTAVLMLVEEGKLSLDHAVSRYIPSFPDDSTTIHHLLSQTSGFDVTDDIKPVPAADFSSLRDWVEVLVRDERAAPVGTYRYTDYNYNFLGQVVEEVSGLSIDTFIEERVLRPLGLEETFTAFSPEVAWAARMNSRYRWNEEARSYRSHWTRRDEQPWPFYPASHGLFSTAMDYARFMTMWMNGGEQGGARLLSEGSVEESLQLHGATDSYRGYGYGWFVRDPQHMEGMPRSFFHGGIDGTLALAFPAEDALVIFLTHSRGREHRTALVNRLDMLEIFDGSGPYTPLLLAPHQADVTVNGHLAPAASVLYGGTYLGESPDQGEGLAPVAQVWEDAGRLHFRVGELGERAGLHLHLVPLGDHRFALGHYRADSLEGIEPHAWLRFVVEEGKATRLEFGVADRVQFSAPRVDPARVVAEIEAERSRIPIDEIILETLEADGIAAARERHRSLRAAQPDSIRFGETLLNTLGYRLLRAERLEEAIAVFEMNVEAHPDAPNPHDSLADAYRAAGRLRLAEASYARAVELAERQGDSRVREYSGKLAEVRAELDRAGFR